MRLNTLKPAPGSTTVRKRLGRGIGSGLGKTGGRGHKGQHARSGGYHKIGFEGGQMPLQRRLPKVGFTSAKAKFHAEICLHHLERCADSVITVDSLKANQFVPAYCKWVKVIASGQLTKAVHIQGLAVSKGARTAIESVGGRINSN